jgi:hypothetical protein
MFNGGPVRGQSSQYQRLIRRQQVIAQIDGSDVSDLRDRLTDFIQDMLAGHVYTQASRYG